MAEMRTPLRRVRGLGATGEGTGHFWRVRVGSVALVPLSLFAIGLVVALSGKDFGSTRAVVGQPVVAILLGLFVALALDHMRLGMQEIILDYAHGELMKTALLMLNIFFAVVLGVACIFAILSIAFGA
jgi:succinate dehydrogenase / fumarate reductase membrane anchor subunit